MSHASIPQLERHIRESAMDAFNVAFTHHASLRMRQRGITGVMVLETLRMGRIRLPPEPDMRYPGWKCRMERPVAGVLVGAVVYVEHPAPGLTVVTVIDLGE